MTAGGRDRVGRGGEVVVGGSRVEPHGWAPHPVRAEGRAASFQKGALYRNRAVRWWWGARAIYSSGARDVGRGAGTRRPNRVPTAALLLTPEARAAARGRWVLGDWRVGVTAAVGGKATGTFCHWDGFLTQTSARFFPAVSHSLGTAERFPLQTRTDPMADAPLFIYSRSGSLIFHLVVFP